MGSDGLRSLNQKATDLRCDPLARPEPTLQNILKLRETDADTVSHIGMT